MTVTAQSSAKSLRGLGWGVFLGGLVPGLLQFQLGQKGRAVFAFASCLALYMVGWAMVRDRLFYFGLFAPETDSLHLSTMAILAKCGITTTLPEILNLPASMVGSILSFDSSFAAQRLWRMERPLEDIGGFLTAASGYLAAFWSADGHWGMRLRRDSGDDTPAPICNPALAAGISWLLPGVGHALAGQRNKGLLMGGATLLVFAFGLLASSHSCDRAIAPVWWIGQSLCGLGTLFASLVTAPPKMLPPFPENLDLGTVLCTVAGLMNLVVMVDAFSVAERSVFPIARLQENK